MSSEDLTLRPQIDEAEERLARLPRAREAAAIARLEAAVRERAIAERVMRHRASARFLAGAAGAAQRGASASFVGAAGGGAARTALAGYGTALLAIGAVAIIGPFLWEGGTLEELSADVNALLLGDVDDDARGRMAARDQLRGNPALMAHVGRHGMSPALERIAASLSSRAAMHERGVARILEARAFASGGVLENLIARARQAFARGWNAHDGNGSIDSVRYALAWRRKGMV